MAPAVGRRFQKEKSAVRKVSLAARQTSRLKIELTDCEAVAPRTVNSLAPPAF